MTHRLSYNTLAKDRLTEIIQNSGDHCLIEIPPEVEYRQALLEKLLEEFQEARQAAPEELVTELADLQEVVVVVLAVWQITPEWYQQAQRQRHVERCSFERRLKLLWTDNQYEDV